MKARIWVLVIVVIVLLLAFGLYIGWRHTGIEGRVERLFLSRLAQLSGTSVHANDFQLGLGYIQLRELSLVNEDRGYSIRIEQARVTVSLVDYLAGGLSSAAGLREMFLSRPHVVIDLDRFRQPFSHDETDFGQIGEFLPERVTISKGSVTVTAAEAGGTSQLISLDGWLERGSLRCTGSWAGAEGNFIFYGTYQEAFRDYDLRLELRQASVPGVLGPLLSDRYTYLDSELFASLQAERNRQDDTPRIGGQLTMTVRELIDEHLDISLRGLKTRARLDGEDVIVEGAEAVILGGQVRAQGRIQDLLQPSMDLRVELSGLKLKRFLSTTFTTPSEGLPEGDLNLVGTLTGSGNDLRFTGRLSAEEVDVYGQHLAALDGHIDARGTRIVMETLTAQLPWARVICQGELDLAVSPAVLEADWRLEDVDVTAISPGLPLGRMSGTGFLAGRIMGPILTPHLRGGGRLNGLVGPWVPVDELTGQFDWDGHRLSYYLESPDGRFSLEGGADELSVEAVHQAVLKARDIPLRDLVSSADHRYLEGQIGGRWILGANSSGVNATGQLLLDMPGRAAGAFDTYLNISRPWDRLWTLDAEIVSDECRAGGRPLDVTLELTMDRDEVKLRKLQINDQLRAFGRVSKNDGQGIEGYMLCNQLDLRWPLAFVFPDLADGMELAGDLTGSVTIGGSTAEPAIQGDLTVRKGRIGRLGDLMARIPLRMEQDTLRLHELVVSHGGRRLMTLQGEIARDGGIDLLAHERGVEAATLAPLFQGKLDDMDGSLSMALHVGGTPASVILEGQLRWQDGVFHRLEFDELVLNLREDEGLWHIERFSIDNWDERHIWAKGSIPNEILGLPAGSSSGGELDMTVGAEGDILSLLAGATSLIEDAGGLGEISFRLGGAPGDLIVGGGRCHFQGGWLEPAVLLERIDDLNGRLEIDEQRRFLHIEDLSGTVSGRPLSVKNDWALADDTMESLIIPGLGLDLGLVSVSTEEDGIEVNLPGLMAKGETGQMRLSGRELQDPLLISGPLESPRVTGMLSLNHVDFTYPPLATSGQVPLSFLEYIRWDLEVMARKDVWYENDFASLRVRDTQSSLHFSGSTHQDNLSVSGHAEADRGEVIYLDRPFQLVELELDFEGRQGPSFQVPDNRPYISGQFETTVYSESTGVATDIYLTLYTLDEETGQKVPRGRWGEFELELSSSDPGDDTQEKVLASLGYTGDYADKALQLLQSTLGPKLENVFLRPVLQPVERTLKKALGIDVIRLQPGLAWNLLSQEESPPGAYRSLSRRLLFPRTTLLVGKYLTDKVFLSYLGKFRTRTDESLDDRLGIMHRVGLEYRLSGGTILDIQYDYERDLTEGDKKVKVLSDKRVQITHNFPF